MDIPDYLKEQLKNVKNKDEAIEIARRIAADKELRRAQKEERKQELRKKDNHKGQLTVTATIYHTIKNRGPTSISYGYDIFLESEDEWYSRLIRVGEEWTRIEPAWVKDPILMLIVNEESKSRQEDIDHNLDRVLELGKLITYSVPTFPQNRVGLPAKEGKRTMFSPPLAKEIETVDVTNKSILTEDKQLIEAIAVIRHKREVQLEPLFNITSYFIRSRQGTATYRIILVPR